MSKKILYNEVARNALKKGVDAVADAVKTTIGPKGKNVVLYRGYGSPNITNDGVSIAREISVKDPHENMGVEITKEVAEKTNTSAGDGTTTAVVLLQSIVAEGLKYLETGVNAISLKKGIERASKEVIGALKGISTLIKDDAELLNVARISAESEEIGKVIIDTINKIGRNGVVTADESQEVGVISHITQGLSFERGYVSPYMVTNPDKMEAEMKECAILVTDKTLANVKEIVPLLEELAQTGKRELVIIAEDIVGDVLSTIVINKVRGNFNVVAVKAPGFGERKKDYLQDIAVVCGATLVSNELNDKFEKKMLGFADKIIVGKDKTTIVGGKGDAKKIADRIASAKLELEKNDSKHDKTKILERIGKLHGGVAVIKVGASTEVETKYLVAKVEDAINAVKAAIEEGIVPGGGTALVRAGQVVANRKEKFTSIDEERGFKIVLSAIEAPLRQIAINAGKGDGSIIVEKVKEVKGNAGYDAEKDLMVSDMIVSGIIDPVKVTRTALENAASSASILLTSDVAVAEEVDKDLKGSSNGIV